jgi:uncharacterized membrane protein
VRAEVSLDPNKLMAELNRSSTRWISYSVCGRLAIISVIVIIVVVLHCLNFIDTEEQITLTSIGSGLIAIIGLYFFYKVNRGFAQFAGDIYPPPMPIHARHKLRLCVLKFHLTLTS